MTDRDIDRLSTEVHKKLGLDASHLGTSTPTYLNFGKTSIKEPLGQTFAKLSVSDKPSLLPLSEMSTVQALNASREECRLKYLTGAAPVVYGLPVWMF